MVRHMGKIIFLMRMVMLILGEHRIINGKVKLSRLIRMGRLRISFMIDKNKYLEF